MHVNPDPVGRLVDNYEKARKATEKWPRSPPPPGKKKGDETETVTVAAFALPSFPPSFLCVPPICDERRSLRRRNEL